MSGGDPDERLAALEERVAGLLDWRDSFVATLSERFDRLEETVTHLVAGRPSWAVTVIITLLAATVTSLGTALVMTLSRK